MARDFKRVGLDTGDPDAVGLDGALLEDHRQRIHMHARNGAHPGMAESIVVDGKVVYVDICGLADKEHRIPMTAQSLFRGYSLMKPVTVAAFMTLVEEGVVSLDGAVADYLPRFGSLKVLKKKGGGVEPLKRKMTMRHLMMHTSGLGYGPGVVDAGIPLNAKTRSEKMYKDIALRQDSGEVDTLRKLCDALSEIPLLFQPGARYEYGLGLDVLGRVIELATGGTLRAFITKRILIPAGMRDTTWDVPRSRAKQICGYYRFTRDSDKGKQRRPRQRLIRLDGKHPEQSAYVRGSKRSYPRRGGVPAGGGFWGSFRTGLLFSLRDVALFCQMLLQSGVSVSGKRILKASTVHSLRRNWLELKSCCDQSIPPGWGSSTVGWSPLGHVELDGPHKGSMFMGGMSYWHVDFRRKLHLAIMTETFWEGTPIGWSDSRDSMDQVLLRTIKAAEKKRTRAADKAGEIKPEKKARKV